MTELGLLILQGQVDQAIDDAVIDARGERGGSALLVGDSVTDFLVANGPLRILASMRERINIIRLLWRSQLFQVENSVEDRLFDRRNNIEMELLEHIDQLEVTADTYVADIAAQYSCDTTSVIDEQLSRFLNETEQRVLATLHEVEAEYRTTIRAFRLARALTESELETETSWLGDEVESSQALLFVNLQARADEAVANAQSLADLSHVGFSQLGDDLIILAGQDGQGIIADLESDLTRILGEIIAAIVPGSPTLEDDLMQLVDDALLQVDDELAEAEDQAAMIVETADDRLQELSAEFEALLTAPTIDSDA
jgi:hypothetical protein